MQNYKEYIYLNISVLLFGLTAVLGELIQLSGLNLVWWRLLITSLSFLFYPSAITQIRNISKKALLKFVGIGILVAIHWFLFYTSIKVSNASVAVVMIATISFYVALIEPLINRRKIKVSEVVFGVLIIPGIYLMNQDDSFDYSLGIWVGLLSSFFAALFSVLNKVMVDEAPSTTITFIEITTGFLFLTIFVAIETYMSGSVEALMPDKMSFVYLVILAVLCTNLPFTLMLKAQKKLSAFTTNFVLNLEPVYGVILAIIILKQHNELGPNFYIGSAIIVGSVFVFIRQKRGRKHK
jgi:drug/metabolite transporter (DMT)-like permease